MYAITATITTKETTPNGQVSWIGSRQIPTFYLDPRVQGILTAAHATKIAAEIIDPLGQYKGLLQIYAVQV